MFKKQNSIKFNFDVEKKLNVKISRDEVEPNVTDLSNVSKIIKNKNILITGGTGSIGNAILNQALLYNPAKITIFSRDEQKQLQMKKEYYNYSNVDFQLGDVRSIENMMSACKNQDIVFHTAALKDVVSDELNPHEAIDTNTNGTRNMIAAAVERKVKQVVNISTDKAVCPTSVLGATKLLAEKLIINKSKKQTNTIFCNVRFGNVIGSRGSIIPIWIDQIQRKKTMTITDPHMTRFMMTLDDAARLVLHAATISKGGETIILKMKAATVGNLAKATKNIMSKKLSLASDEICEKTTGRRNGEKIHEALLSEEEKNHTVESKDFLIINNHVSCQNKTFESKWTDSDATDQMSYSEIAQTVSDCLKSLK